MILHEWAQRHSIPSDVVADLMGILSGDPEPITAHDIATEAGVQSSIRLMASARGARLWRNNVGVAMDENGRRTIRYGLANESTAMNKKIKSSDLIGVRPVVITPEHVGQTIGQFVAIEVKAPAWKYRGTPREVAQLKFINIITGLGGLAKFSNDPNEVI